MVEDSEKKLAVWVTGDKVELGEGVSELQGENFRRDKVVGRNVAHHFLNNSSKMMMVWTMQAVNQKKSESSKVSCFLGI